ncbi:hypothetical protein BWQ96_05787 [Gracilariopsis chorda]|uniref:Uncharacterized protein n=1 Tax=Gracilariopsis chorda TaxID=448386 RepID=A0A2V3IQT9_9FLOR|nr:hypothetical protein BWQ96_05787 [Gracilariopsis chorda]|eukprot:PXF44459.1 hypothetical protein BWQ96_05787 [Gracilariopsis chorda]
MYYLFPFLSFFLVNCVSAQEEHLVHGFMCPRRQLCTSHFNDMAFCTTFGSYPNNVLFLQAVPTNEFAQLELNDIIFFRVTSTVQFPGHYVQMDSDDVRTASRLSIDSYRTQMGKAMYVVLEYQKLLGTHFCVIHKDSTPGSFVVDHTNSGTNLSFTKLSTNSIPFGLCCRTCRKGSR